MCGECLQQNQRQKLGVINMDVAELSDHFEVHASLPGVKKDQVKLDVDGDILRVSCETKEERLDQSPEGLSEDQQQVSDCQVIMCLGCVYVKVCCIF